jgi:hypothetical protein
LPPAASLGYKAGISNIGKWSSCCPTSQNEVFGDIGFIGINKNLFGDLFVSTLK